MKKLLLFLLTVISLTAFSQEKVIPPYRVCVNDVAPTFVPNYKYGCKEVLVINTRTKYVYNGDPLDWGNGTWERLTMAFFKTGAVISSNEILALAAAEVGDYWEVVTGDIFVRDTGSTWKQIFFAADKAKLDLISVTGAVDLDNLSSSYTVTQSDVTQHEAALTITESQITDLAHTEIQQLTLNGNTLTLEDGGTVDLSTFLNTDNQTITDFSLSGTMLSITLEDGNTETVDISGSNYWTKTGTDLSYTGTVSAADPVVATDLVTKQYLEANGDNLGSHKATINLDLNDLNINNIKGTRYRNLAKNNVGFIGSDDNAFGGASDDFTTYIYGNNSYHIATNSTRQLTVNSTGAIIQNNIPTSPNHLTSKNYVDYEIGLAASPWTKTGTDLGYTGNVGIGTTSPSEKLHVNGNAQVDGNIYAPNLTASTTADKNLEYNSLTGEIVQTDKQVIEHFVSLPFSYPSISESATVGISDELVSLPFTKPTGMGNITKINYSIAYTDMANVTAELIKVSQATGTETVLNTATITKTSGQNVANEQVNSLNISVFSPDMLYVKITATSAGDIRGISATLTTEE